MAQPEGYVESGKGRFVCKLNRSLYGLKQPSRCWFNTMDAFLKDSGYEQCKSNPMCFPALDFNRSTSKNDVRFHLPSCSDT